MFRLFPTSQRGPLVLFPVHAVKIIVLPGPLTQSVLGRTRWCLCCSQFVMFNNLQLIVLPNYHDIHKIGHLQKDIQILSLHTYS